MDLLALIEAANGKPLPQKAKANAKSVVMALATYGPAFGMLQPHRLAQYLAQLAHESGGFRFDREVWGPTPAQKRYEGRKDLGNVRKGDGSKFRGHGPIQVTGRANHAAFRDWCRKHISKDAPDFEENPEAINTDPWEGLTGVWYWSTRNLNRHADEGDVEMITRRINGGYNGLEDRINWLVRFSLVMHGMKPTDIEGFQKRADLVVDGIAGPKTRATLHKSLVALTGIEASKEVKDAPVTTDRPTVPDSVVETTKQETGLWGWLMTIGGAIGSGIAALRDADWQTIAAIGAIGIAGVIVLTVLGPRLVRTISDIKKAVEA